MRFSNNARDSSKAILSMFVRKKMRNKTKNKINEFWWCLHCTLISNAYTPFVLFLIHSIKIAHIATGSVIWLLFKRIAKNSIFRSSDSLHDDKNKYFFSSSFCCAFYGAEENSIGIFYSQNSVESANEVIQIISRESIHITNIQNQKKLINLCFEPLSSIFIVFIVPKQQEFCALWHHQTKMNAFFKCCLYVWETDCSVYCIVFTRFKNQKFFDTFFLLWKIS